LAARRDLLEDRLQVGQEAQVEHLVGLVEYESAYGGEVEVTLPGQVEESAGGADHDLDAAPESFDLWLVGAAAVNGKHPGAQEPASSFQVFRDLNAKLTGGNHGKGQWAAVVGGFGARSSHPLEHRDAEREGLAGARAGLPDDIGAGERDWQCQCLNREGIDDPGLGQRRDNRLGDPEGSKIGSRNRSLRIGGGGFDERNVGRYFALGNNGRNWLVSQRRLLRLRTAVMDKAAHNSARACQPARQAFSAHVHQLARKGIDGGPGQSTADAGLQM